MADWLALVDAHGGEYYLNLDLLPGARFQQARAVLLGLTDPEGRAVEVADPAALAVLRRAFGQRAASSGRDQRERAETDASAEGPQPIVMADSVSISSRGGDSRIIPRAEW